MPKGKILKKVFNVLTGVVVGGAIGSILGLTLAPKKGTEMRKALRDKSMELFLRNESQFPEAPKTGRVRQFLIKLLKPKGRP